MRTPRWALGPPILIVVQIMSHDKQCFNMYRCTRKGELVSAVKANGRKVSIQLGRCSSSPRRISNSMKAVQLLAMKAIRLFAPLPQYSPHHPPILGCLSSMVGKDLADFVPLPA